MAVPVKDDEGLVGEAVRGVLYFEGRTLDDCLKSIEQAVERITRGFNDGANYLRGVSGETGYYSFEVEEGGTGDGN
jgi:hypothetical protein